MSSVAKKIIQTSGGTSANNLEFISQKRGAGSVTVNYATDYLPGDILFALSVYYSNTAISPEDGWTLINSGLYVAASGTGYQSFAFSRNIADLRSGYIVNSGNIDNVIVVFRPTGYDTFTEVDEDEGLNGATASITMTDTNDSLYLGFGAALGDVVTVTKPSFATEVDVTGSSGDIKFYWAYQEAGHGNTGTQTLDVSGTFEVATAIQLDLT